LIDEAVAGLGMAIVGGGQFVEKQGDCAIMDRRGHAVDADGQRGIVDSGKPGAGGDGAPFVKQALTLRG